MRRDGTDGPIVAIQKFFQANPDEELTIDDCVSKFQCSRTNVYHALEYLRNRGLVYTAHVVRAKRIQ